MGTSLSQSPLHNSQEFSSHPPTTDLYFLLWAEASTQQLSLTMASYFCLRAVIVDIVFNYISNTYLDTTPFPPKKESRKMDTEFAHCIVRHGSFWQIFATCFVHYLFLHHCLGRWSVEGTRATCGWFTSQQFTCIITTWFTSYDVMLEPGLLNIPSQGSQSIRAYGSLGDFSEQVPFVRPPVHVGLLLIMSVITMLLCSTMKLVSKGSTNFARKGKEFNPINTATIYNWLACW